MSKLREGSVPTSSAGTGDGGGLAADVLGVGMQQQPQQQQQRRSKKLAGGGKRRARGGAPQEEVALNERQAELVKCTRVEARKAENNEDLTRVQLSRLGKAAQLVLSEDRLSVTGRKGFRTARCSHGVFQGTWYCEVTVKHLGTTGHVRLGWCTRKAELQAPVGFDTFGYCYRDLEGSKVHEGRREPYGAAYGQDDVVGLLLHMPEGGKPMEMQDRQLARFKGQMYNIDEPELKPQPLSGSAVVFSVNGVSQGAAYRDILEGTYYPAASLFTLPEEKDGATVTFNFGPDFKHAPPVLEGMPPARAMCELAVAPATDDAMDTAA